MRQLFPAVGLYPMKCTKHAVGAVGKNQAGRRNLGFLVFLGIFYVVLVRIP